MQVKININKLPNVTLKVFKRNLKMVSWCQDINKEESI